VGVRARRRGLLGMCRVCSDGPSLPLARRQVKVCCDTPASAAARVALKQLHQQCRASKEAAAVVGAAGGVEAAHKMLATTDSQEALGLLWSLSAIPGTLEQFTPATLADIVQTGRRSDARDGWRKTAALSALHNLLCYSGYSKVLEAGALDWAMEVLAEAEGATTLGAQAAAALLIDQCCFDIRSKLPAVQALRVPVLINIFRRCRPAASPGGGTGGDQEALLGHMLSLLWNATDDVFFAEPDAWAQFTRRICEREIIDVLHGILRMGTPILQQGAGAILHNLACNRALHPTLLEANTLDIVIHVAERGGEGAICCMLAAAEFVGSEELGPGVEALQRCDIVQVSSRPLPLCGPAPSPSLLLPSSPSTRPCLSPATRGPAPAGMLPSSTPNLKPNLVN